MIVMAIVNTFLMIVRIGEMGTTSRIRPISFPARQKEMKMKQQRKTVLIVSPSLMWNRLA